jgi:hypothetical protein
MIATTTRNDAFHGAAPHWVASQLRAALADWLENLRWKCRMNREVDADSSAMSPPSSVNRVPATRGPAAARGPWWRSSFVFRRRCGKKLQRHIRPRHTPAVCRPDGNRCAPSGASFYVDPDRMGRFAHHFVPPVAHLDLVSAISAGPMNRLHELL